MKQIRALLVLCWIALAIPLRGQVQPFGDVPIADLQYQTTALMFERGVTTGCGFSATGQLNYHSAAPDNLTRAAAAVFIIRSIFTSTLKQNTNTNTGSGQGNGDNFTYSTTPHFSDVPKNHPAFPWIQAMQELNITTGCGGGKYCPDDTLHNWEIAVFIVRARALKETGALPPTPLMCNGQATNPNNYVPNVNPYDPTDPAYSATSGPCSGKNYYPNENSTPGSDYAVYHDWIQRATELAGFPWEMGYACPVDSYCTDSFVNREQAAPDAVYGVMGMNPNQPLSTWESALPTVTGSTCNGSPAASDVIIPLSATQIYSSSASIARGLGSLSVNAYVLATFTESNNVGSSILYSSVYFSGGGPAVQAQSGNITPDLLDGYSLVGQHQFSTSGCTSLQTTGTYTLQYATPGSQTSITLNDPVFQTSPSPTTWVNPPSGVQPGYVTATQCPSGGAACFNWAVGSAAPPGEYQLYVVTGAPEQYQYPIMSLYVVPSLPTPLSFNLSVTPSAATITRPTSSSPINVYTVTVTPTSPDAGNVPINIGVSNLPQNVQPNGIASVTPNCPNTPCQPLSTTISLQVGSGPGSNDGTAIPIMVTGTSRDGTRSSVQPTLKVLSAVLSATCSVSPNPATVGQLVTFTAIPVGGGGTLTYSWSGKFSATSNSPQSSYTPAPSDTSPISESLTVTDTTGHSSGLVSCPNVTVNPAPSSLTANCTASPNPAIKSQTVIFTASQNGGTGPYTYSWSGPATPSASTPSTASLPTTTTATPNAETVAVKDATTNPSVMASCPTVTVTDFNITILPQS